MMAAPLVWAAAAVLLWWGRLEGEWRRGIALASSAVGLIMLMLALNTEGQREAPTTAEFLLSGRYVTGHVSASASLPYYVITSVCLLLGTAGLVVPDQQARRLDGHWFAAAVLLSYAVTALRFALEKVAAPTSWTNAVGVTWLGPVVGAYFLMHLRERGQGMGALALRLLAYAAAVRVAVTLLMVVATTYRLGSHYDLSGFTRVRVPITGADLPFRARELGADRLPGRGSPAHRLRRPHGRDRAHRRLAVRAGHVGPGPAAGAGAPAPSIHRMEAGQPGSVADLSARGASVDVRDMTPMHRPVVPLTSARYAAGAARELAAVTSPHAAGRAADPGPAAPASVAEVGAQEPFLAVRVGFAAIALVALRAGHQRHEGQHDRDQPAGSAHGQALVAAAARMRTSSPMITSLFRSGRSLFANDDHHRRPEVDPQPPANRLPDEGQPGPGGAEAARGMGALGPVRGGARRAQGGAGLHPPRRPALRQRRHPPRDRPQQGPEGHRGPQPHHVRLRRALRPGLGLPRPAHRAEGRQGPRLEEEGDVAGRVPPRVPQVRREVARHPARAVQAPGRDGRVGRPVHDDGPRLPGHHRARAGDVRREGPRLQGQEVGALVHLVPHRAGRGRGRVRRRAREPVDRRPLPRLGRGAGGAGGEGARPARPARERGDLDHDAVDAAREPRPRLPSRRGLRVLPRRGHGRRPPARQGAARVRGRALEPVRSRRSGSRSRR